MSSLAFTLTAAGLAFSLSPRSLAPRATLTATVRARPSVAFLEPEEDIALSNLEDASVVNKGAVENMWVKTASGLRYKELERVRGSAVPVAGDIVALAYTASILSTGQVLEATSSNRPLEFIFGQNETLFLFDECAQGMSVGSKRRVMLSASSALSETEGDETLQFDIELKSILNGTDATAFRVRRALPAVIRTAILLSFVPDILRLFGVLPGGAMSSPGFGAVDILSTPSAAVAPTVDAANMWAAQGLQGLF